MDTPESLIYAGLPLYKEAVISNEKTSAQFTRHVNRTGFFRFCNERLQYFQLELKLLQFSSVLLCGRPNRPQHGSCPSVLLSVCLAVCLSRTGPNSKTQKIEKPKLI